jgi:hypothetical protein
MRVRVEESFRTGWVHDEMMKVDEMRMRHA